MNAYKKGYPDLKKAVQLEKAQKLWNYVKNDLTKFEETVVCDIGDDAWVTDDELRVGDGQANIFERINHCFGIQTFYFFV